FAAVLCAAAIGTAFAMDTAPAPRPVPLPIAPLPHHDLRGYVAPAQAIAADPKLMKSASHAAAGFLGVIIRADSANRPIIAVVERDSPADDAGLKAGDLVARLDNTAMSSDAEVRDQLRSRLAGETVDRKST